MTKIIFILTLLGLFIFLQYKLWFEQGSLGELVRLKKQIAEQRIENSALLKRNETLIAEVKELKHGQQGVEGEARSELGMIKQGETFYQIVDN